MDDLRRHGGAQSRKPAGRRQSAEPAAPTRLSDPPEHGQYEEVGPRIGPAPSSLVPTAFAPKLQLFKMCVSGLVAGGCAVEDVLPSGDSAIPSVYDAQFVQCWGLPERTCFTHLIPRESSHDRT
jgi:hypothetical protein